MSKRTCERKDISLSTEANTTGTDTATRAFDPRSLREQFPVLERTVHGKPLVYLDNAATTQKPRRVIDAESRYYERFNSNVHRGLHTLSEEATTAHEATRDAVASWIGGVKREEVVFTSGTTGAINTVALSWGMSNLAEGDRIVLTRMEHHANLVPWLQVAKRTGAEIGYVELSEDGRLEMASLDALLEDGRTKIVSLTHMSNVLGTVNPVKQVAEKAHAAGALVLVDGAQAVANFAVDVHDLDVDFYAFSAHKMFGPTGVGVLYGREKLLEEMEPFQFGGEMIQLVKWDRVTWAELPHKFEAGTPNIAGVVAFREALGFLADLGMDNVREHDARITEYALDTLRRVEGLTILGPDTIQDRGAAVSMVMDLVHPHDLAQLLDSEGIAARAGHHCAQPLHRMLGHVASTRASFTVYNTEDEVDRLADALIKARRYFMGV